MVEGARAKARIATPFGLFRYAVDRERTVLGGAVSNAGNLRRWCLRELRVSEAASHTEKTLSRAAAASDEITVLPFWVNERAPTWPENLHGVIMGLNQTTSAAQILRATTCSVFYRLGTILDLVERAAGPAKEVIVSGGILHSPRSLRLLADAIGRDLRVSSEPEASLRGAAVYALERLGHKLAPLRKGRLVRHIPLWPSGIVFGANARLRWKVCSCLVPTRNKRTRTPNEKSEPRNGSSRAAQTARDLTIGVKTFFVYMMTNRSRVVLSTGVTNSLERRIWFHRNNAVKSFTKTYKVDRLVYYEQFNEARYAIAREKEIKGWRREKKNDLVRTLNPKWKDLGRELFDPNSGKVTRRERCD